MTGQTIRQTLRSAAWLAAIAIAGSPAMAQPASADAPPATGTPTLAAQIAAILAPPDVARDHWGIAVTTLDGTPIYALNEAQLFQPDSNAKLFTTAAALALLGPFRTFQTVVAITAPIKKGILHGNLYLVGGGDANFGVQDVPYLSPAARPKPPLPPPATIPDIDNLADQIVAKGIQRIEGDILGDDSLYKWRPYPHDWSWDDLVWGYGAPLSALTIHDNAVEIRAASGSNAFVPDLPYYAISNHVGVTYSTTRDCDSLHFSRFPGSKEVNIEGALPDKAPPCPESISIDDPAEYAAIALKAALEKRGVRVLGSAKPWHNDAESGERSPISIDGLPHANPAPKSGIEGCFEIVNDGPDVNVIAQHSSPPLTADVTFTNKVSQNLHAELMLRNIAQLDCDESGKYPEGVRQFLITAGLDPNDFLFYDGSGLSGHDLVTPRAVAKLLSFAAHDPKTGAPQPWFADWKASLPVGGVDGSLDFRFTKPPLKGHVFAKTGTHSEGRALSGYLDCASGRTVIFSILVNNHLPGSNVDRDAMDQIVAAIAATE
jgi:D-alanyl-D-alanine carboxypeptidase/D-alanyl-D-alanine-endopeptidase (penicillin-binding protein 4)